MKITDKTTFEITKKGRMTVEALMKLTAKEKKLVAEFYRGTK